MAKVSREAILEQLNWRYATKRFDSSKKISDADFQVLEEALRLSPSSYGIQPWKFIVVQNPEIREKLKAAAYGQPQLTEASHIVVFSYRKNIDEAHVQSYINRTAEVRGIPTESLNDFKNMMLGDFVKGPRAPIADTWCQRQVYISLGFLVETAALLEIDACPMEGFDASAFDKILGLEGTGWGAICMAALGYRSSEDQLSKAKKVRFAKADVVSKR